MQQRHKTGLDACFLTAYRNFTGNKKQFAIHTDVATFGLPYDYQSVMHYPVNAFAIDPYIPTIVPKIKGTRFGDYKIISALDAVKLQRAYKCFPDAVTVVDPDEDEDDTERDPPTQKSTPIGQSSCGHLCSCPISPSLASSIWRVYRQFIRLID